MRIGVTTVLKDDLAFRWAVFLDSLPVKPPVAGLLRTVIEKFLEQEYKDPIHGPKYREALTRAKRKHNHLKIVR